MKNKSSLQIIAQIARAPEYTTQAIKSLMKKLNVNERAFAMIMNVSPITVRFWTTGAAKPCGIAQRLMQFYENYPELVDILID